MFRYKLTLEYEGTSYQGFQMQQTGPTVQGVLEGALKHFHNQETRVYVAGRTDAGVHATGQVCHVDLRKDYGSHAICSGLNFFLQAEKVRIIDAEKVPSDFHARFSAIARKYRYRILNRKSPSALEEYRTWHLPHPLDLESMSKAANHLIGTHDFSTFRTVHCQAKSSLRTLDQLDILLQSPHEIHVIAQAKSFLHHQVRNMVGSLVLVGQGRWSEEDLLEALHKKDRTAGGPTAPAQGLYLEKVFYPE